MSDVDPTAPGGMPKKAIILELHNEFGYTKATLQGMSWPEMIDALVLERKAVSDLDYANNDEAEAEAEVEVEVTEEPDPLDEFADLLDDDDAEPVSGNEPTAEQAEAALAEVGMPTTTDADIDALLDAPDLLDYEFAPADPDAIFIGLPNGKDYIFDGHLGASPSSAERWMNCTASLGATRAFLETLTTNQQIEYAEGSTAARQGTTAHAAAEVEARLMLGEVDQAEYDATILELTFEPDAEGEAYNEEMAEHIAEYGDLIKSYVDDRGTENVLIEQHVEAVVPLLTVDDEGNPNLHTIRGSADGVVLPIPEHPDLVVADLKYGSGIDVSADQNPQLRIYALGALALCLDEDGLIPSWVRNVVMHVVQPRLGGIKTFTESVDDLLDWAEQVLTPALTAALGGAREGASFKPAPETCQWCPVRGSCEALIEQRMIAATELFDVIQETEFAGDDLDAKALSNEDLGRYYTQIKGLVSLADDLKAEAQRRLYRGDDVPGFQLVNYTPPRHWADSAADDLNPEFIDDQFLDPEVASRVLYKTVMLSPTQAVQSFKAEGLDPSIIEPWIVKPDIRPVVGPIGDRRKPWAGRPPEAMFDIEDGE